MRSFAILALAALVLTGAARLRGAEYDEGYSLFVTAGIARPDWPRGVFAARAARTLAAGHAGPARIAAELRATDVHPPLYFWALGAWRAAFGPGLFAARLLAVLCALAALALTGAIAAEAGVPAPAAMAFTLGCYGFAYTGAIARDFALAEALALAGIWAALRGGRRAVPAGLLLGAACFANYLACFVGAGVVVVLALSAPRRAWRIGAGMAAWLPPGAWFFLAQRNSRSGQFPPFRLLPDLVRLARDGAGAVFGGLPLYLPPAGAVVLGAALGLVLAGLAVLIAVRFRRIGRAEARAVLAAGALAPPLGLLVLGVAFDTTPIEIRYLAFATPFLGLLLSGALATLPRPPARAIGAAVLGVQALALAGLMLRPETMQPGRRAAREAARLAGRAGVVLLPRGNDGVGVVAPFLLEAPAWLRVRLVSPASDPAALRASVAGAPRVVLALVGVDGASRASLVPMRTAFAEWRVVGRGFDALALAPPTAPPPAAPAIRSRRGTSPPAR
ncbi:MAG: hypothetical protein KGI51_02315 [Rhodospirillales bacterium]|nr:hypothetical protein [Rhodospirillales bacterium]